MGSSGSGKISDYPGSSGSSKGGSGKGNTGNGGAGGRGATKTSGGGKPSGTDDRCAKAFSAKLEDVEHSDYFRAHGLLALTGIDPAKRFRSVFADVHIELSRSALAINFVPHKGDRIVIIA